MGLMGFVRSGLRENWHIYGVMQDTSQWAYTPSNAEMARMVGGITIVFLAAIAFLHGVSAAELTDKELGHVDPDYEVLITVLALKHDRPA